MVPPCSVVSCGPARGPARDRPGRDRASAVLAQRGEQRRPHVVGNARPIVFAGDHGRAASALRADGDLSAFGVYLAALVNRFASTWTTRSSSPSIGMPLSGTPTRSPCRWRSSSGRAMSTARSTASRSSNRRVLQRHLAAGEAGHIEQVVDEPHHVSDLSLEHLALALEDLRIAQLHQLERGHGRRQRVAQLVPEHGEELVLGLVGVLGLATRRLGAFHFLVALALPPLEQPRRGPQRLLQARRLGDMRRGLGDRAALGNGLRRRGDRDEIARQAPGYEQQRGQRADHQERAADGQARIVEPRSGASSTAAGRRSSRSSRTSRARWWRTPGVPFIDVSGKTPVVPDGSARGSWSLAGWPTKRSGSRERATTVSPTSRAALASTPPRPAGCW